MGRSGRPSTRADDGHHHSAFEDLDGDAATTAGLFRDMHGDGEGTARFGPLAVGGNKEDNATRHSFQGVKSQRPANIHAARGLRLHLMWVRGSRWLR